MGSSTLKSSKRWFQPRCRLFFKFWGTGRRFSRVFPSWPQPQAGAKVCPQACTSKTAALKFQVGAWDSHCIG